MRMEPSLTALILLAAASSAQVGPYVRPSELLSAPTASIGGGVSVDTDGDLTALLYVDTFTPTSVRVRTAFLASPGVSPSKVHARTPSAPASLSSMISATWSWDKALVGKMYRALALAWRTACRTPCA